MKEANKNLADSIVPIHCPNVFETPLKVTCYVTIELSSEPLLTLRSINRAYFWPGKRMPTITPVSKRIPTTNSLQAKVFLNSKIAYYSQFSQEADTVGTLS